MQWLTAASGARSSESGSTILLSIMGQHPEKWVVEAAEAVVVVVVVAAVMEVAAAAAAKPIIKVMPDSR